MKKRSIHYVNNADFSQAVVDYVRVVNEARKNRKNNSRNNSWNDRP